MFIWHTGIYGQSASDKVERFRKVTDASTLKAGDTLLLVNEEYNVALGKKKSTNFGSVNVSFQGEYATAVNATSVILGGTRNNWTLKSPSGYLCSSSSSSALAVTNKVEDKSKSTITITNGDASITFKRYDGNCIRYNHVSDIFACYKVSKNSNTMNPVQIYRKETTTLDVPLTIGKTGYATLYYSDRALIIPQGIEAYTYSVRDGALKKEQHFTENDVVPAATGIVLHAQAPGSYLFTATSDSTKLGTENMLRGSDVSAETDGGEKYYKLSTKDGKDVGFYWGAVDGGKFTNGAHKAYLAVPADEAAKAKAGYSFDATTDGLSRTDIDNSHKDNAMYNIAGQRVSNSYKGLVICDGKKKVRK